ncbi:DUF2306 domain-containing protein [Pseudochryseolinea flava]|uniref:DUF2306 domain-containing protein n=1 Tax=Pseudochryseolinea flava TaxID=2059302 RepID=A0A364Y0A0_9BACT|nr:DUF2306 domain-containing protein [Pseudochryseolinea flava]RAW00089.1 hypothetical protein DQQ10_16195 [Pseudochryseolinea flava]
MQRVLKIGSYVLFVIVLLLAILLTINTLTYLNFDSRYSFLRIKQEAIATGWYLPAYYAHVLLGGLILLSGFFQLYPNAYRNFPSAHRRLGYFYVMGILFFAAPGGLVMSLFIGRGPVVLTSFLLQTVLWFTFTAIAFDRIRKRQIDAHREWMWRSFALTFAAVTLRIYIYIFSWSFELAQPSAYAVFSWLSWVPNLVVVELFLRSKRRTIRY